jgi:hypothetical protein
MIGCPLVWLGGVLESYVAETVCEFIPFQAEGSTVKNAQNSNTLDKQICGTANMMLYRGGGISATP